MDFESIMKVIRVFNYFIISFSIILNGMVIIAFLKMRKTLRKKPPNVYLVNQAFADLFSVVPHLLITFIYLGSKTEERQKYYKIAFLFSSIIRIGSVMLTTTGRFIAIKYPLHHLRFATKYRVYLSISIIWVISAIPSLICLLVSDFRNVYYILIVTTFASLLMFIFMIFAILFVTFKTIRSSINRRVLDISSMPRTERNKERLKVEQQKENRVINILLFMVTAYAITIFPCIILVLLASHYSEVIRWARVAYYIFMLSLIIDPLLTVFMKDDFKQAKGWIVLRCFYRRQQAEAHHLDCVIISTRV